MKSDQCFDCDDHAAAMPFKKHPDHGKQNNDMNADHQRGVGGPAKHTHGKMHSQLNPDHGPHK